MSIIKTINGGTLPDEAAIVHDVMTIDKGSGNNLNGDLMRTVLGEKDKFTITFPPMNKNRLNATLAFFRHTSMSVVHESYWDSTETVSQPMYHGDMSKEVYSYVIGDRLYYELKVELISYKVRKIRY